MFLETVTVIPRKHTKTRVLIERINRWRKVLLVNVRWFQLGCQVSFPVNPNIRHYLLGVSVFGNSQKLHMSQKPSDLTGGHR